MLQVITTHVDLLQVILEVVGNLFKNLQNHHILLVGIPVLKSIQELFDGFVLKRIDGYDLVVRKNNTNGDGDVERITVIKRVIFRGSFDDDELNVVVNFIAAAFVNIEGILQEIYRDVQRFA